jgi:nucleoside-diphosphate-sugar epimerase
MRVLIAGATGALGVPLVRQLRAEGHHVIGLARTTRRTQAIEALGAEVTLASALDFTALRAAVVTAKPDVVVHALTAIPPSGPTRPSHLTATNILRTAGTENLLAAATAAGARRLVLASMVFVYGFGELGARLISEEHPLAHSAPRPGLLPSARALASAEAQVQKATDSGSIEGVIVRFGSFYGPRAGTDIAARLLRWRLLTIPRAAHGSGVPWIHIDDAASGVVAAMTRGRAGQAYNIVDDEAARLRDVFEYLATVMRLPQPPSVPMWMMQLMAPFLVEGLLETTLRVSNAKAKTELDWRPRFPTYREGLTAFAEGR